MNPIITIKAFNDNFIYLCQYDRNNAIAIDPGDSSPVLKELEKNNMALSAILLTHHHSDHTGGASELKKKTGCKILSGDGKRINAIDYVVQNKQILTFGKLNIEVITTPGHTSTSNCYYIPPNKDNESGVVFTGDTLFIGGCGRLFECDAQTMWESLQKLAALPKNTLIYPGHDYTLENYKFAQQVEPDNQLISERIIEIKQGKPTVPSTIAIEKETNIFLKAPTAEIFAELRRRKDNF